MKTIQWFSSAVLLLLALSSMSAIASAASFSVSEVKIDGVTATEEGDSVDVQVGETLDVDVVVEGTGDAEGVRVKAWIGGYEHGDVEAVSKTFDVESGVSYKKSLDLELPSDLDVGEGDKYTLYVEVYNGDDSEKKEYNLFVERPRHAIQVLDVVYDSSVNAGDDLPVEVRLKNVGESKEEDIKVQVSLNGKSEAVYVDELAAFEDDSEDEEDSTSATVTVTVSADLASGDYDLTVTVTYDDGHETVEDVSTVSVNGAETAAEETTEEADVTLSVSSSSLSGEAGDATSFALTFANTGTDAVTYTVSVAGVDQWATTSVSPSVVVVESGETKDVTVTLTPKSDASGNYDFTVNVLDADGELAQEVTMKMSVDQASSLLDDTSSLLKLGFVVVLVVVIVVGLVVAFRKLGDGDDGDDELLEPKDGKTYY